MEIISDCQYCYKYKKWVSIFVDTLRPEFFYTGIISEMTQQYMVLNHFSPAGEYDGFVILRMEDIVCIEYDGRYEKKIEHLSKEEKQLHRNVHFLKKNMLTEINRLSFPICIFTSDDMIYGMVQSVKQDRAIVCTYNEYGLSQGSREILFSDIQLLEIDSREARDLHMLVKAEISDGEENSICVIDHDISEWIQDACGREIMASIYASEENANGHLTGIITECKEPFFVIKHMTPEGEYDGYFLVMLDDVWRIEINGPYERKIEALYRLKNQTHREWTFLEGDYLQQVYEYSAFVSVETESKEYQGILKQIGKEFICLSAANDDGSPDGIKYIRRETIMSIGVDGKEERRIMKKKKREEG